MGSGRLNPFSLLPTNVASEIFSHLQGQDLCYAASTCRDFRCYISTVESLKVPVALEKRQAKSLLTFVIKHVHSGMLVKFLALRLKCLSLGTQLQDWDAKGQEVLGCVCVIIKLCSSQLLTLKLEHLSHFDFCWRCESLPYMTGLKGHPLLVCINMCRHLRRLHISTTFLPEVTDHFMDMIALVIIMMSPNLAILEWRHTETCRVGPDFFSEGLFAGVAASKTRGLQLLQVDDCNFVSEKAANLPSSLRFLALHNFEVPFAADLASVLGGLPKLEELYLAPFRVPDNQPLSFTKLWPSMQSLRTLVLHVISEGGFDAPEGDVMEMPNLEILVIEDFSKALPPLNLRCPELKTLAVNMHGGNTWGNYFARLPLSPGLVNLQLRLQTALPDTNQLPIFWNALGAVQSLTRLKLVFTAFDVNTVNQAVLKLLEAVQLTNGSWPSLQELGLYLSSRNCCNNQPYFTTSPAGNMNSVPPGVKSALVALQQKMIFPALKQVWLYPVQIIPGQDPEAVHAAAEPVLYAGDLAYTHSPGLSVTALDAPGHEIWETRWRTMGGPEEADAIHRALCSLDCEIDDIGEDEGVGNGDAANQEAGNDDAANEEAGNTDAANEEAVDGDAADQEAEVEFAADQEAGNNDAANQDAGDDNAASQEAAIGVAADQMAGNGSAANQEVEMAVVAADQDAENGDADDHNA